MPYKYYIGWSKEYYRDNREKILEKRREHYQVNREKILEKRIEYSKAHPEKCRENKKKYLKDNAKSCRKYLKFNIEKERERLRKYRRDNPEKCRERCRKYRRDNPEKVKERVRKWQKNNPEKCRLFRAERREKIKKVIRAYTLQEWKNKLNAANGICIGYEREPHFVGKLTMDHIIAIDKAPIGFVYTINDIQPLCFSCNVRKSNKLTEEIKGEVQAKLFMGN